jgi:hypothetical protein
MAYRYTDGLPGALLAVIAVARPWLDATMVRHMAIEIPVLFIIGWIAAWRAGARLGKSVAHWDAHGIPVLLYATLTGMFWMMPVTLDKAVLQPSWGILKILSIVLAGFLLGARWCRVSLIIQSFIVLNAVSMLLTGGLLYQQAQDQLCSVYFSGQQSAAGVGLLAWALIILAIWLVSVARHPMIRSEFYPSTQLSPE